METEQPENPLDELTTLSQDVGLYEDTPSTEELKLSEQLEGTPHEFDKASVKMLEHLCQLGVAAKFKEGYARGFRWHQFNH